MNVRVYLRAAAKTGGSPRLKVGSYHSTDWKSDHLRTVIPKNIMCRVKSLFAPVFVGDIGLLLTFV